MITFTPDQMQALDAEARTRFAQTLSAQLRDAYPALFDPLPPQLAQRLVAGRIDYAEARYAIHFQSALTTYLHYCCAIGADFDRQPAIQALLDDLDLFPDDVPDLLAERIDDKTWEAAEAAAHRRDWLAPLAPHDRVAARYRWALPAHLAAPVTQDALDQHVIESISAARQAGIVDEAGQAAYAFCRSALGDQFAGAGALPWVRPIFHDPAILPALRGATLAGCVELEWQVVL